MYIETHAHYDDPKFSQDRDQLIPAIHEAGIDCIINCASDLKSCRTTLALSRRYPYVYAAIGVHPEEIGGLGADDLDAIYGYATSSEKVRAIGEIGLDYHYEPQTADEQQSFFMEQCEMAIELDLPVIVHSRDAAQDTLDILSEYSRGELRGVVHAFSGAAELARRYVSMGYYLGIGGMVTFPNVKKLIQTVEEIPLEHFLLETDSPYLAPVPRRGARNDSRNLAYIAQKIAEIKQVPVEEVARVTSENARNLFRLPARNGEPA